eukprot:2371361-Prorocentrum_lima.AAC.1
MTSSLVGSEMCIRDSNYWARTVSHIKRAKIELADEESEDMRSGSWVTNCLLYTSDAADDM